MGGFCLGGNLGDLVPGGWLAERRRGNGWLAGSGGMGGGECSDRAFK